VAFCVGFEIGGIHIAAAAKSCKVATATGTLARWPIAWTPRISSFLASLAFPTAANVEDVTRLAAGHQHLHAPLDDAFDFPSMQVDGVDSVAPRKDHLLAVGGKRVLMEIQALAAWLSR
jgi:hypothetical protein